MRSIPGLSWAGLGSGNDRPIRQEPEDLQPGRRRRRGLLHPEGQGQDHGAVRARQGSGGRDLSAGQFFGEACLEGAELRTATSQAMEECLITSITKPDDACDPCRRAEVFRIFHRLSVVPQQPDRRRSDRPAVQFAARSASRVCCCCSRILAHEGGRSRSPITLSQETLAEMIGTTRSRVSFFMNKFRKKGYIDYNGKIEVQRVAAGRRAARKASNRRG